MKPCPLGRLRQGAFQRESGGWLGKGDAAERLNEDGSGTTLYGTPGRRVVLSK